MLVPLLGVVVAMGYKTHGLRHLHVEDIEAVGAFVHLDKKETMVILDTQDPMLDLHA